MNTSMLLENQLLATKFFVPVISGSLISRSRLIALLQQSLKNPLTLLSAPAGFGKTTLLSAWAQSLLASDTQVAWISLDEEDNDPKLFWTYILTAMDMRYPERFRPLLMRLQSPQGPPLKYILKALINLLVDSTEPSLLILDDYQVITEQNVHTSLSYLVEHLPPQLHIILATRADPPLLLSQLRACKQIVEVRTNQLRCTVEETKDFFHEVMGIKLPEEIIREMTARTEGWLVGLQLLGLSLQKHADPTNLLEEASGSQHYVLDYLTQEVLQRQPQEVQRFLLSTCILERLTAPLCDAVVQQSGSEQMLERLEEGNLFVVSLDTKRQWYRYHTLFAEALRYRLNEAQVDLIPILHHRASLWYAQHDLPTQAILHALSAHQWQWAADLIERLPSLLSFSGGTSEHKLVMLRQWLELLPAEIVGSRPHLCLACAQILWAVTSHPRLQAWLDAAEAALTASLTMQTSTDLPHIELVPQARKEQKNLLGEVIAWQAQLRSFQEGQVALPLCQRALTLLSADNSMVRAQVACAQLIASYASSTNNAVSAVESGFQAVLLAQEAGLDFFAIALMGLTALYMIGTGQLHAAHRLSRQAIQLGKQSEELGLSEVGWPMLLQAEILREWNQLDAARSLAEAGISLCTQAESIAMFVYILSGYAILAHIYLSCGEYDAARSALQQVKQFGMSINQPTSIHYYSLFTTIDQVRFWLASGEMDHATRWAKELDIGERHGNPFVHEREEVAYVRVLLAKHQPVQALTRLEPLLVRATTGQRWGHVIEIRLLQALAHQMCQKEIQALDALSEAVRLAEPEGYIRSFVDEGAPMGTLLYHLRKRDRKSGPTPYLDTVLAAFQQEIMEQIQV
ncbi:MAG TPA: LuxR family transcriptional regulator, partial [Ktedonobacteraceae bacterium]|nr:LuxR family transcriptional regulator [Ktedonobacteraceae bacterium]